MQGNLSHRKIGGATRGICCTVLCCAAWPERDGEMKVKLEIQQMVDFRKLNLDQQSDLVEGSVRRHFLP